ncbi:unnamed protein product [Ostreobium quekettii]|uniref:Uncharacterized protein n=1 Tax=Ostreobium quekettii TaxID=121088 RepID=A0A8S1IMK3_9CHLO|nr:unnamed protein product [Ostreobium quekettii]
MSAFRSCITHVICKCILVLPCGRRRSEVMLDSGEVPVEPRQMRTRKQRTAQGCCGIGPLGRQQEHDSREWCTGIEERRCAPWNGWLKFFQTDYEAEFWNARMANLLQGRDFLAFAYALMYFACMALQFAQLQGEAPGVAHKVDGFLVVFLVFVGWAAVESYRSSDRYRSHRLVVVGSVRFLSVIFSSRYTSMLDPHMADVGTFFHVLLRKSTLTVLMISPLLLQLPFPVHTAVNSASLLVALLWATPNYCQAWTGSYSFTHVAKLLEEGVNTFLMMGAGGQADSSKEISSGQSCWLVVSFIQVVLGFVVPTALVYGMEALARTQYLLQRFPATARFCLPERHGLVVLIVGMVAVTSSVAWICLRAFLELGELNLGALGTTSS